MAASPSSCSVIWLIRPLGSFLRSLRPAYLSIPCNLIWAVLLSLSFSHHRPSAPRQPHLLPGFLGLLLAPTAVPPLQPQAGPAPRSVGCGIADMDLCELQLRRLAPLQRLGMRAAILRSNGAPDALATLASRATALSAARPATAPQRCRPPPDSDGSTQESGPPAWWACRDAWLGAGVPRVPVRRRCCDR